MLKILVPLDLSEISLYGLNLAFNISKRIDSHIILLNYVTPPEDKTFTATGEASKKVGQEADRFTLELAKKNKSRMEALVSEYSDNKSQTKFSIRVEIDFFEDAIDDFIKANNVDLVVMGTSGESTFKEIFLGNHTEKVIRISNCPVLSVKEPVKDFNPDQMVLATDLSTESKVEIDFFKRFAGWFQSKMHILHIVSKEKDINDKLKQDLDNYAHQHQFTDYQIHIKSGSKKDAVIKNFADEIKAGLLGVTTHARSGLSNLFLGSLSEDLTKEAERPVLVLTIKME